MTPRNLRRYLAASPHALLIGAVVGLALVASEAVAQQRVMSMTLETGGGGTGEGQITRTSVWRYADLLGLEEDQREVLGVLFEGYASGYQAARQAMTEGMAEIQREFQDSHDMSLFSDEMPEITRSFREKSESLESGFFEDLRAVLTESQGERMGGVERMRRRETQLRFNVSGASVDLVDIVRDLDLGDGRELGELVRAYELDMDRMLRENERASEAAISSGGVTGGFEDIQEAMGEAHKRGLRVRDMNRRHARSIASMLGGDTRERFEAAVRERSFPRVYRLSYPTRMFDAAAGFGDLNEEQGGRLGDLRESYDRDLGKMNERWANEMVKADDDGARGASMFGGSGGSFISFSLGGDDGVDSPLDEARKARRDLDKRAEKKIRDILSEDQIARLPERRDDDQQRGGLRSIGGSQMIIRGG